jgi:hypothetical protein
MKLTHLPSGEKLGPTALPTRAIRATATARSLFCEDDDALCCEGGLVWEKTANGSMAETESVRTATADLLLNMLIS